LTTAETEMRTIASALETQYPKENQGRTVHLAFLSESAVGANQRRQFVQAGGVVMTIAGVILLIACANLANVLRAQGSGREKEMIIRVALRASRTRLICQLLTESMLLSFVGGITGLVLAYWGRNLLWSFRPPFIQGDAIDLAFDTPVLIFAVL